MNLPLQPVEVLLVEDDRQIDDFFLSVVRLPGPSRG
jgi:hypothetical protein